MLGLDTVILDTVESTGVPGYNRLYCAGYLILDTVDIGATHYDW